MAETIVENEMETQDMNNSETSGADLSSLLDDDHDHDQSEIINKDGGNDAIKSKIDCDDSNFGIARLLQGGTEFESYKAFQATLQQYSDVTFATFTHQDSSTVEKLGNAKDYNKNIVYTNVVFACIYGGKKLPSKSSGIRNCSSRKIGCPVKLRLVATPDKQRLVIKESKLDCHNHDLSEENYRLKSLDEETEFEIYNLISMHENKRVARQLVRDKLAKETGKNINMKDISNIEKRVIKKIEKQPDAIAKEEEEEQISTEAADDQPNSNSRTEDNSRAEDMSEEEEKDDGPSSPTIASLSPSAVSSPARPKRRIREPKRFRDVNVSKKEPVVEKTPVATTEDKEKMTKTRESRVKVVPETPDSNPSEPSSAKVEKRGRKRKVQLDSKPVEEVTPVEVSSLDTKPTETDRKSEIRERKLAIQEELLALEKKKMTLLQDISTKLDTVLENLGKG